MGAETWIAIWEFTKAIFIGAGAGASAGYVFAVNVARMAVLALAAKAFTPKPDLSVKAQEKLRTVRDTIHPQRFLYGRDMVSGPLFFGFTYGQDNKFMTLAVELVGHECDAIEKFRFDDIDIDVLDISSQVVTTGQYQNEMKIDWKLGTQTQQCSTLLSIHGQFGPTTHVALGHTYMVVEMELVPESQAYENGSPSNLKALIRGKKIYDPRLDTTNGGTGPHRLADPSTWEWSDNPALCLADFILDEKFGMKETSDRIDWPMVITAADICDELVSIPGASTQKRYTCNVTFESTENRGDVRDALLNAMLGRMVFSQGLWKIWAGAPLTADVTLNETNLAGQIQVQATAGAKERYNRVRGKFIDPSRNYAASSYPELRSATYEAADNGEVRPLVADFLATHNTYEAQRKGIITLKQSRQQRVVVFQGNLSCFRIQAGSVVQLTLAEYGFNGELFFVTEWKLNDQGVELTMIEEDSTSWDDPLTAEYAVRSPTGTISFGSVAIPPPSGVVVVGFSGGIYLTWTAPATIDATEIWASDDNVRGNAQLIATVMGDQFLDQVSDTRTRFYWLRSVSAAGVRSAFEPDLTTTTYTANSPLGQLIASVPSFAPGKIGGASNLRFTVNQINGGAANDGEIRVQGTTFEHPDGTTITTDGTDFYIATDFEGAVTGQFYVMYSATAAETRFGGVAADWGGGAPDDTRFCVVVWDSVNGWRAKNNSGAFFAFTPLTTDCIIAICNKLTGSGGIETIMPLLSGIQGDTGPTGPQGDPGADGGDGLSVYYATVYQRSASAPATPTGGTYNFGTKVHTPPAGWSATPPATDGNPLWVSVATYQVVGTTGTDSSPTWSTPAELVTDGADGAPGTPGADGSAAVFVNQYIRSATQPATPGATSASYNFDTQTFTPTAGWSSSVPANDGNPVWVTTAQFFSADGTGTDSNTTWPTPQKLAEDGADGAPGADGSAAVYVNQYQRSASAPATPGATSASYNFDTQTFTPTAGWSASVPAADGNPVWVTTAQFFSADGTGTDNNTTWSAPQKLAEDGATGAPGGDGQSTFVGSVYIRSASAPATPTADDGQYNFSTGVLTPPTGWSTEPPAEDGNDLYISTGLFSIVGTTGTDTTVTWTAPIKLLSDLLRRDIKFQRSNTQPATPTGDNPAGWFDAIPSGVAPVWQVTGNKNSQGTLVGSWSTPALLQGMVYRGAYSGTTAYILHDVVSYQERTYICVQAGTGNAPSGTNDGNAFWDLLAGKGDPGDQATFNETITVPAGGPVNLRNLANNHTPPYDGVSNATITFNFNSGTIQGTAGTNGGGAGGDAIDTGSWPAAATINLTLNVAGTARGGGGGGGNANQTLGPDNGEPGGSGGDAINCQEDITINVNTGGVLQAAGGGGGGGGSGSTGGGEPLETGGGGGGGGYPNGGFGAGGAGLGGAAGSAGTTGGGGAGGGGGTNAGAGGSGGNVNVNGSVGQGGSTGSGGSGGNRGAAVRKNGNTVTVNNNGGTITGDIIA